MKLTKEDYMRLPKERLAELCVEMQDQVRIETVPVFPEQPGWDSPYWQRPYPITSILGEQESTNEIKN